LKNGDRVAGEVISEDTERIVLTTEWNAAIFVPLSEVLQREIVVPVEPHETSAIDGPPPDTAATSTKPIPQSSSTPPQDKADHKKKKFLGGDWKWDLRLGFTLAEGARTRQVYYGSISTTFARPYRSDPRKFFRNKTEYRLDYGETDGDVSANQMVFANKTDIDVGTRSYIYNIVGVGYDRVRLINLDFEVGPGAGYRLVNTRKVALNFESGLNFQRQDREQSPHRDLLQLRLAQQLTWEIIPKVKLDQKLQGFPSLNDTSEYQIRAEVNLAVGVISQLSINFTVINLYDAQPATGVPNNELQFRSAVGVQF
jgi:putative salt-induced outer membrane protein YdiY